MKWYKIAVPIIVIVCLIILVFSYLNWQKKLDNVLEQDQAVLTQTNVIEKEPSTQTKNSDAQTTADSVTINKMTANMDEQVRTLLVDRNSKGNSLKMLITGSAALESGEPGYAERLKSSIEEAYDFIEVTIVPVEKTSEFLANVDLSAGYDLVLLEPMTLMNNDRIAIEQEREHIDAFASAMAAEVEDAVLVLQPPQPIYSAGYYTAQVAALDEFAATNGYAYIDHWPQWPDTDDELLNDYLTKDELPNSEGAKLWAKKLAAYFIAD